MKVEVSKEIEFDAGHRVPDHGSKCRNPHGHRYRVRVTCSGDVVDEAGATDNGMVVDFGDLKAWMTELVHDVYDHGFIVFAGDRSVIAMIDAFDAEEYGDDAKVIVVPFVPTAENLARSIFTDLDPVISEGWHRRLTLERVEVWETPTSLATVTR